MRSVQVTNARNDIYNLIDAALISHEPVQITSKKGNVIIISEEDWSAIEETLYLLSIPGMRETLLKASSEPIEDCKSLEDLGWDLN